MGVNIGSIRAASSILAERRFAGSGGFRDVPRVFQPALSSRRVPLGRDRRPARQGGGHADPAFVHGLFGRRGVGAWRGRTDGRLRSRRRRGPHPARRDDPSAGGRAGRLGDRRQGRQGAGGRRRERDDGPQDGRNDGRRSRRPDALSRADRPAQSYDPGFADLRTARRRRLRQISDPRKARRASEAGGREHAEGQWIVGSNFDNLLQGGD